MRTAFVCSAAVATMLITSSAASGQSQRRLAVLEFRGTGLQQEFLEAMANRARAGALTALASRPNEFLVMTRESMLALLKDMGRTECTEGNCEVETARNIGADLVVTGEVVLLEGTFVVDLKLHESVKGQLLAMENTTGKAQLEVLERLAAVTEKLLGKALKPATSPTGSRAVRATTVTSSSSSSLERESARTLPAPQTEPVRQPVVPGVTGGAPLEPAPPEVVALCKTLMRSTHVRISKACKLASGDRRTKVTKSQVVRLDGLTPNSGAAMLTSVEGVQVTMDCSCLEGL